MTVLTNRDANFLKFSSLNTAIINITHLSLAPSIVNDFPLYRHESRLITVQFDTAVSLIKQALHLSKLIMTVLTYRDANFLKFSSLNTAIINITHLSLAPSIVNDFPLYRHES